VFTATARAHPNVGASASPRFRRKHSCRSIRKQRSR
jgi:hypothetical protein